MCTIKIQVQCEPVATNKNLCLEGTREHKTGTHMPYFHTHYSSNHDLFYFIFDRMTRDRYQIVKDQWSLMVKSLDLTAWTISLPLIILLVASRERRHSSQLGKIPARGLIYEVSAPQVGVLVVFSASWRGLKMDLVQTPPPLFPKEAVSVDAPRTNAHQAILHHYHPRTQNQTALPRSILRWEVEPERRRGPACL